MTAVEERLPIVGVDQPTPLRKSAEVQRLEFVRHAMTLFPSPALFWNVVVYGALVPALPEAVESAGYRYVGGVVASGQLTDLQGEDVPADLIRVAGAVVHDRLSGRDEGARTKALADVAADLAAGACLVLIERLGTAAGDWTTSEWLRQVNRAFHGSAVMMDMKALTVDSRHPMLGLVVKSLKRGED